jgi:uncharacterized membrane protein YdcZ (DUF606 family)
MKKLLILLSLLITANVIVTTAHAELNEHVVPALKIAGGTLAAATAIGYATLVPDVGPLIPLPAITSATILSAMAFGLTGKINTTPAAKIAGTAFMGLSAYFYFMGMAFVYRPKGKTFLERNKETLLVAPAVICTATLAALSFKSLITDEKFLESLKYIFC